MSSYTFEEYGISFLFKSIHEHRDLSRYLHPSLYILEDYDRKNAKNYMLTLRKYLENNNNIKITAEELFLHRNTLIYRTILMINIYCACFCKELQRQLRL